MDIKKIQKRLNEIGYTPKLDVDGLYGDESEKAVIWFQKKENLTVDGVVGNQTLTALFKNIKDSIAMDNIYGLKPIKQTLSTNNSIRMKAMEIAISQYGVKEKTGRNDGEAVETFLHSIGLGKGYSWCMAFVYWCYEEASKIMEINNPLIKTGGVLRMWNEINPKYKKTKPEVGSIVIMDFGKGNGHTGIVLEVLENGNKIKTIEGNSNDIGSREGNQVGYHIRSTKTLIKGYITI